MENEQKIYEIGYLLSPLISEEKLDEEIGSLRKLIEDKKGLITAEGRPKTRRLAYPINGLESAYFGWIKFMINPDSMNEIKSSFEKLKAEVIRFLITKTTKETVALAPAKKIIKKKKNPPDGGVSEIKAGVKFEEIDKKLEELLGKTE